MCGLTAPPRNAPLVERDASAIVVRGDSWLDGLCDATVRAIIEPERIGAPRPQQGIGER
jgi:hypothetical protein